MGTPTLLERATTVLQEVDRLAYERGVTAALLHFDRVAIWANAEPFDLKKFRKAVFLEAERINDKYPHASIPTTELQPCEIAESTSD